MIKPTKLNFGPSGIPRTTPEPSAFAGVKQVDKLGLEAMELAFVHSVFLKEEKAQEIKKANKNVLLTAHGSYYVNLNSIDKKIIGASRSRIIQAAKALSQAGGYSVCFHAAYYLKEEPRIVYNKVEEQLRKLRKELVNDSVEDIWIRPETTGKNSQFGTIDEILKLSQDVEGVMPCVDFSHLHARSNGKENTKAEFETTLEKIETTLGKEGLNNMHIHLSGIAYGEKGEKHHLNLKDSDMNYSELLKVLKEFKVKGALIAESPNQEDDALMLQKLWGKI